MSDAYDEGYVAGLSELRARADRAEADAAACRDALTRLWRYSLQHCGDWYLKTEKREHALRVDAALSNQAGAALLAELQQLRERLDRAWLRVEQLWSFVAFVRNRDWTLEELDRRTWELYSSGEPMGVELSQLRALADAARAVVSWEDEYTGNKQLYPLSLAELDKRYKALRAAAAAAKEKP